MAEKLFGTDGIRDRAGHGFLTSQNVIRLGYVTGRLLKVHPERFHTRPASPTSSSRSIVIARDTRQSGASIERDLAAGLSAAGVETISAGILPTPALVALTRMWQAPLGMVISASHNPSEDNGIKMISPEGFKIPDEAEAAIEEEFFHGASGPAAAPAGKITDRSAPARRDIVDFIDSLFKDLSLSGLKIVLDCAHGAAFELAPELLRLRGAEVVLLNTAPDGLNINDRCGATHPEVMARAVAEHRADLGVAFDGDADRVIACDETGTIRDGDDILAIAARDMKSSGRLGTPVVVSTLMANYGLEKFLKTIGVELVRTPVGDKYVAAAMLERGALLGGEQSGHVIFMDAATTGDGLITALKVAQIMTSSGQRLSHLCSALTRMPQVLTNVRVIRKTPFEELPEVQTAVDEVQKQLTGRGRLVLRYSGTELLARVMVEGEGPDMVQSCAERVARAIRKAIGED